MIDLLTTLQHSVTTLPSVHPASLSALLPMDVPNPGAGTAPPGVGEKVNAMLGWAKWLCLAVCIVGIMVAGAMMAIGGRRGEGGEHAGRLAWAMAGVAVISGVVSLVGFMVK